MKKLLLSLLLLVVSSALKAQVWSPDLGNGNYKNPIIYADYSDPDVIRVDDDYYMIASSFAAMPGIPILHSTDLVNWEIVNHVFDSLPFDRYERPAHGQGAWAPCLRYHDGKFYVYVCTPSEGLFVAITDDILGKWELTHVVDVELWEDPSPLWDDDGNAYLVRSKLGGGVLYLHKMSSDGKKILDNGTIIFNDPKHRTVEGPKFMKMNGYYYINAPAGGVEVGWQIALRSKNIYGPYEVKVVLETGSTEINGPHQGGLVDTKSGEWWFIHFQSKGSYGRIVHLQPVEWIDGWPMMGIDNNGVREPVMEYQKPNIAGVHPVKVPQTTDQFDSPNLGKQWQWHGNPKDSWYSLTANKGKMRLYSAKSVTQLGNMYFVPNQLLQKFPAPEFKATTHLEFNPLTEDEKAGLIVMGNKYWYSCLQQSRSGVVLRLYNGASSRHYDTTKLLAEVNINSAKCYMRVEVAEGAICQFSYSTDGKSFTPIGEQFEAAPGGWIGAKVGIFSVNPNMYESTGYADFENFVVEKL